MKVQLQHVRGLKLRAKGRQFDEPFTDPRLQATHQGIHAHPQRRRLLRADHRWRTDLLEVADGPLPR